ncbi:MAG: zinc-dependent metalloprotease family protein [Patescibacteria group bacterium]
MLSSLLLIFIMNYAHLPQVNYSKLAAILGTSNSKQVTFKVAPDTSKQLQALNQTAITIEPSADIKLQDTNVMQIPLPQNSTVTLEVENVVQTDTGFYYWTAKNDRANIIGKGGTIYGHFVNGGKVYEISHKLNEASTKHIVTEVNTNQIELAEELSESIYSQTQNKSLTQNNPQTAEGVANIRILFAYTDEMEQVDMDINEVMNLMVENTNKTLRASDIGAKVVIAGIYKTTLRETSDIITVRRRAINPSDGNGDELHDLRENTQADLVAVITATTNTCGNGMYGPNWHEAFMVVRYNCEYANIFAHEVGHALYMGHDDAHWLNPPNTTEINRGFISGANKTRSTMAYTNAELCTGYCWVVKYYSTPNKKVYNYAGTRLISIGDNLHNNVEIGKQYADTIANLYETRIEAGGGGASGEENALLEECAKTCRTSAQCYSDDRVTFDCKTVGSDHFCWNTDICGELPDVPPVATTDKAVKISGYVFDIDGNTPKANVDVAVLNHVEIGRRTKTAETTTDAQGRYYLEFNPTGVDGRFTVVAGTAVQDTGVYDYVLQKNPQFPIVFASKQGTPVPAEKACREINSYGVREGWYCDPGDTNDEQSWWKALDSNDYVQSLDFRRKTEGIPIQNTVADCALLPQNSLKVIKGTPIDAYAYTYDNDVNSAEFYVVNQNRNYCSTNETFVGEDNRRLEVTDVFRPGEQFGWEFQTQISTSSLETGKYWLYTELSKQGFNCTSNPNCSDEERINCLPSQSESITNSGTIYYGGVYCRKEIEILEDTNTNKVIVFVDSINIKAIKYLDRIISVFTN